MLLALSSHPDCYKFHLFRWRSQTIVYPFSILFSSVVPDPLSCHYILPSSLCVLHAQCPVSVIIYFTSHHSSNKPLQFTQSLLVMQLGAIIVATHHTSQLV